MGRKVCIPGLICVENITLFIVVIFLLWFCYYFFTYIVDNDQRSSSSTAMGDRITINVPPQRTPYDVRDVLLNPYAAPYYDSYNNLSPTVSPITYGGYGGFGGGFGGGGGSGGGSNFRQVGILSPKSGDKEGRILPLLGRPLTNRSNQWNYYTIADQHNNVKIPVRIGSCKDCRGRRRGGKDGLSEYGVGELGGDDTVFLDGVDKDYRVTMYNSTSPDFLGG